MYDLIGDIHGHADELVQLLEALGYKKHQGVYRHPERQVIFLGDFIDRGPKIRQVLEIVRPMIDQKAALAVMGNHELNALAYHTAHQEKSGEYLRHRSPKNTSQHKQTLDQLKEVELEDYLKWFGTLPMWLDLPGLRVVHACWDDQVMALISNVRKNDVVDADMLKTFCLKNSALYAPVEIVLKGKEAKMPEGASILDKDGHHHDNVRVRWYLSPKGQTYRTYAFQSDEIACDLELEQATIDAAVPYPSNAKPVFFGHYWLNAQRPSILADNVACIDFSVAKGGFLCAYRWQGEQKLSNDNFVWVNTIK